MHKRYHPKFFACQLLFVALVVTLSGRCFAQSQSDWNTAPRSQESSAMQLPPLWNTAQQTREPERLNSAAASVYADTTQQAAFYQSLQTQAAVAQDEVTSNKSIAIPPPSASLKAKVDKPRGTWQMLFTTLTALVVVLGVFAGLAMLSRKTIGGQSSKLPTEVFEVLGRSTYAPRQQVLVLRFGSKLLLVNQEPGNVQTLSEIDSPEEVDRIAGLCEQSTGGSVTQSFNSVMRQVSAGKPKVASALGRFSFGSLRKTTTQS